MTTQYNPPNAPAQVPQPNHSLPKSGFPSRFVPQASFGLISVVMALIGLVFPWQQSWWNKAGYRKMERLGAFHELGMTKVPAIIITILVIIGLIALLGAMFKGRSAKVRAIIFAVYTVTNVAISITLLYVMTSQSAVAKVREIGVPFGDSGGVGFGVGFYLTLVGAILGIIVGIVLITQAIRKRPTIA